MTNIFKKINICPNIANVASKGWKPKPKYFSFWKTFIWSLWLCKCCVCSIQFFETYNFCWELEDPKHLVRLYCGYIVGLMFALLKPRTPSYPVNTMGNPTCCALIPSRAEWYSFEKSIKLVFLFSWCWWENVDHTVNTMGTSPALSSFRPPLIIISKVTLTSILMLKRKP